VELRVLGVLHARAGAGLVDLRPVERRLLAAVVVQRPESIRYDALADAVWGARPPRSATRSLQTHVLRIRASLGHDLVETTAGGYRLADHVELDSERFAAAVQSAGATEDPATALRRWNDALSLWGGDPFEDLDDWPPAVAERARLVELWDRALEGRCAASLSVLPPAEVIVEAERLVHLEPLRERRWCLLLTALAMSGRRADALRAFDRARRTLATELGISPGVELVSLHESLLSEESAPSAPGDGTGRPRPKGILPAAVSSILGRDDEVGLVHRLVLEGRLVTLTGAAGVGKSRLAVAVGEGLRSEVSGGVWWVELAATRAADAVDPLIASTLGFIPSGGRGEREAVIAGIADRELVLVLDNCEHLLNAVVDFVADALARCPNLRILTTSREPLAVPGEQTVRVSSLPVDGAAVDLFVARAREADPSFVADDPATLNAISRRLDGIPLAIELTAARVRTLGLRDLASRLLAGLDLLTAGRRGPDERHHTMRAAIDWSVDLLEPTERTVFERLGVFRGRFDLDAAACIVGSIPDAVDVAAVIASLVDKSMLVADGDEPARFRLLEPLRHYASERLTAIGDADPVAGRYIRYYAELAARLDVQSRGPDEVAAVRRLEAARDHFRSAFHTAVERADIETALSLATALTPYARAHVWTEPWSWCAAAVSLPGAASHPLRPGALLGAADGAWQLGRHQHSVELAEAAIAVAEPESEVWRDAHAALASALVWLGPLDRAIAAAAAGVDGQSDVATAASLRRTSVLLLIRNFAGRPEPDLARRLLDDAHHLANPSSLALAFHTAGVVLGHDDRQLSVEYQRRAVTIAAEAGAVLTEGFALATLAAMEASTDPVRGARAQVEVMNHYLRVGNHTHLRTFGRGLIISLVAAGAHEPAAVLDGATQGLPGFGELFAEGRPFVAETREVLGVAYDLAAERGAVMTDDELVAYLDVEVRRLENQ
jgi:predicted ATPase/DNA-binding SARP family transcriptional activator